MKRIVNHIRHNLIAYIALFVALGGTSYAASSLPANSVGGPQLKDHAIDPVKLDPSAINGSVAAWAIIGANGRVIAGAGKPRAYKTPIVAQYQIDWGVKFKPSCATVATIDSGHSAPTEKIPLPGSNGSTTSFTAGYAVVWNSSGRGGSSTVVATLNQAGQLTPLAFDVAVIC
jgi:hypothetical protein